MSFMKYTSLKFTYVFWTTRVKQIICHLWLTSGHFQCLAFQHPSSLCLSFFPVDKNSDVIFCFSWCRSRVWALRLPSVQPILNWQFTVSKSRLRAFRIFYYLTIHGKCISLTPQPNSPDFLKMTTNPLVASQARTQRLANSLAKRQDQYTSSPFYLRAEPTAHPGPSLGETQNDWHLIARPSLGWEREGLTEICTAAKANCK